MNVTPLQDICFVLYCHLMIEHYRIFSCPCEKKSDIVSATFFVDTCTHVLGILYANQTLHNAYMFVFLCLTECG